MQVLAQNCEATDPARARRLREAIAYCESVKDYVSREVFEHILESEEEHIDFLETQLELIGRVGIQNYCQSQIES